MTDLFSRQKRREIMQSVRREGTTPERRLASLLDAFGFRYQVQPDLVGKPDFYFSSHRVAVFVHGCFWHGHTCKKGMQAPKTNTKYWTAKVVRNQTRDRRVARILRSLGISVYVVRECELRAGKVPSRLLARLTKSHS